MPIDEHSGAAVGDKVTYQSMAGLGDYEATILHVRGAHGQIVDIKVKVTRNETLDLTGVPLVAPNKIRKGACFLTTRPAWTGADGKAK